MKSHDIVRVALVLDEMRKTCRGLLHTNDPVIRQRVTPEELNILKDPEHTSDLSADTYKLLVAAKRSSRAVKGR